MPNISELVSGARLRPAFAGVLGVILGLSALPQPAAAADNMVVAVLYFDNNTGDANYDILQKGLADMLVTDLSQVPTLQVVEREKLQKLLDEMNLQRTSYFDPKTAQKLGRGIGAQYAVTGAFAAIAPEMRIDIRLVEVATARVVMADKVVGKKDAFFDLQSRLVTKFIHGLNLRTQIQFAAGVQDVATLLAYSQGVDSADRGDLEAASRKLGALVQSAPQFTLARRKYAEIIKRLHLAKKRRQQGLSAAEQTLLQHIERELAKDVATLTKKEAPYYFGYRVAKINYHLSQVRKLAALPARERGPAWVPKDRHADLRTQLATAFTHSQALIADMKSYLVRTGKYDVWTTVATRVHQEDQKRGTEIGIAGNIGAWSGASPYRVGLALAKLTVMGTSPWSLGVEDFAVRPTLAELDPSYAPTVLGMLASGRQQLEAIPADHRRSDRRQRDLAENIDTHAEILLRLGRREEAIAQWQSFLDQYPKATDYEKFETKIEDLLGISADAQAFQAALGPCTNDLFAHMHKEAARVRRADGAAGLRRLAAQVEQACNRGPLAPGFRSHAYYWVAHHALELGDCSVFLEVKNKAHQMGKAYASSIDQLKTTCR